MALPQSPIRQSIEPTYDSRETGPQYWVTSTINDRPVAFREPIDDPFVRHTVHLSTLDLLRGLFRRRLTVEVTVDGTKDRVDDVLELDANTLTPGVNTRRIEFNQQIHDALGRSPTT